MAKTGVWWCKCGAARSGLCCTALSIPQVPGRLRLLQILPLIIRLPLWRELRGAASFIQNCFLKLPSSISKCMQTNIRTSTHYVTAACCDSHWLQPHPADGHSSVEREAESKRLGLEPKPCRGRTDGETLARWLEREKMAPIRREINCTSSLQRVSIDLCPYAPSKSICEGHG